MIGYPPMTRLRIYQLLEERGMTISELAKKINMSKQNLEKFANDETAGYRKDTLNDVAYALDCRVADLFEGEPETPESVRQLLEEHARRQARRQE